MVADGEPKVGTRTGESRREFLKRTATAGAAFAISKPLARLGFAAAPDLDPAVVKKFGATQPRPS
jgi:hypothetical protein